MRGNSTLGGLTVQLEGPRVNPMPIIAYDSEGRWIICYLFSISDSGMPPKGVMYVAGYLLDGAGQNYLSWLILDSICLVSL